MEQGPPRVDGPTVDWLFADFMARRAGILKALTTDFEEFYQQCDREKQSVCLYGLPNEKWEVGLRAGKSEFPQPVLGMNLAREGKEVKDWLAIVAAQSHCWLISMAFHIAFVSGFTADERKRLFCMINDLPTIPEALSGAATETNHRTEKSNPSN